jgi:hypothetical protein
MASDLDRRPAPGTVGDPEPGHRDLRDLLVVAGAGPPAPRHAHRNLRHTSTVGRPKQGRSANSTISRSLTTTGPSQPGHDGRQPRVSIQTRSPSPISVTSSTVTSGRPTSSSHIAIGSDDNRGSRISKALNTSRLVEPLSLCQTPDPAHTRSAGNHRTGTALSASTRSSGASPRPWSEPLPGCDRRLRPASNSGHQLTDRPIGTDTRVSRAAVRDGVALGSSAF